jgi:hypothetical protein
MLFLSSICSAFIHHVFDGILGECGLVTMVAHFADHHYQFFSKGTAHSGAPTFVE